MPFSKTNSDPILLTPERESSQEKQQERQKCWPKTRLVTKGLLFLCCLLPFSCCFKTGKSNREIGKSSPKKRNCCGIFLLTLIVLLILGNLAFLDWHFFHPSSCKCGGSVEVPRMIASPDGSKPAGVALNTSEIATRETCQTLLISQSPKDFFSVPCAKHPCCSDLGIVTSSVRGICVLSQIYAANSGSNLASLNWMTSWNVCGWEGVVCRQNEIVELRIKGVGNLNGGIPDDTPNLGALTELVTLEWIGNATLGDPSGIITSNVFGLPKLENLFIGDGLWKMQAPSSISFSLKNVTLAGLPHATPVMPFASSHLESLSMDRMTIDLSLWNSSLWSSTLQRLRITRSNLLGPSSTLGSLKNLKEVLLMDNSVGGLEGALPSSLCSVPACRISNMTVLLEDKTCKCIQDP